MKNPPNRDINHSLSKPLKTERVKVVAQIGVAALAPIPKEIFDKAQKSLIEALKDQASMLESDHIVDVKFTFRVESPAMIILAAEATAIVPLF